MSKDIIDAIASGDNLGAESQFKNAISAKVGYALEKKREEVANTMVTQHIPEVEDEEVTPEPVVSRTAAPSSNGEDDTLSYFAKLANED